ncbi:MAG: FprA family A-type flavoprotein [Dehalococcoidia bacterium]|nr:FprA family A-type flavoprotein [Dehalococcoidia bacterium]MDZ4245520.1 FprA family A-type flavoprotein [Dehalococcoidia bacterium]
MKPIYKTVQLASSIHWVGVEDWQSRLFDSLIPLPYGTSYNSYLVVGQEKVALIDTVHAGFTDEWLNKIISKAAPGKIDYLVMNHGEPDHGGSISRIMAEAPDIKLVLTEKGAPIAKKFYGVGDERTMVVKDGDTIDLGGKTLRFIEAPWVHWPETMFTFVPEDRVLFSCDFFGTHLASDLLFDDEVGELVVVQAKRYFADIMMPLIAMAGKALEKAKACDPLIIGPSHGPVWRNPGRIFSAYDKWINGPLLKKAVIIHVSMYGATARLAEVITKSISAEGVEAVPYNLVNADTSHIAGDLLDCSVIVFGAPTVTGNVHPVGSFGLILLKYLRPRTKKVALFSSYGWSGGAMTQMKAQVDALGFETIGTLEVQGPPSEEEIDQAIQLGKQIAGNILGK